MKVKTILYVDLTCFQPHPCLRRCFGLFTSVFFFTTHRIRHVIKAAVGQSVMKPMVQELVRIPLRIDAVAIKEWMMSVAG